MELAQTDHFVVAIGASAGGLSAITELLEKLPADLSAPVIIAVHSDPESRLTEVLGIKSSLDIVRAKDGDVLEKGRVYVVPGARHAFLRNGKIYLSDHVKDSGFRPSIDALFMTLAAEYGPKSIAVVLSGTLKDGMRGAQVVHDMGGRTIVQAPHEATHSEMPKSVILHDHPDTVRIASELGKWLTDQIGRMD